ncbi:MAG: hypothetical protein LBK63_01140, partial [Treponema sp.]|nr:hypothetical protein [Treponema sp.]
NAAGPWADYVPTPTNGETIGSFDPFNTGVVDHWHVFDAGVAGTYQVQWEDRNNHGSTVYNADVTVSAYKFDFTTPFFTNVDSGYTTPESINLTAGETIHVKVTVKGSYPNYSNGTYLLRFITP